LGVQFIWTGARRDIRHMTLDPQAIQNAERALGEYLRAEAEQQQAYLCHFPDGRISLELEWLDVRSITQTVIAAYVASLRRDEAPTL
jgi:hypothetical protein